MKKFLGILGAGVLASSFMAVGPMGPPSAPLRAPGGALPVALDEPQVSREEVNTALDRGLAWLLAHQDLDGRFRIGSTAPSVGEHALLTYTAIKSGLDPDSVEAQRAVIQIRSKPPSRTYERAVAMLALQAQDAVGNRKGLQLLLDQLLETQESGGDWGYPGSPDLSNSQYAALGLWAATKAGLEIEPAVWKELARATAGYRTTGGGYGYRRSTKAATGTMTTAALANFGLCESTLIAAGALDRETEMLIRNGKQSAVRWLTTHFTVKKNPDGGHWHYYYLYGLERAGAMARIGSFGKHDWYQEGARLLIDSQHDDGSFGQGKAPHITDTCFALLFLRRATAPTTGARVPGGKGQPGERNLYGSDDPGRELSIRASGRGRVTLWVSSYGDELLALCGGSPTVLRVDYWVNNQRVKSIQGDRAQPALNEKFPFQVELDGAEAFQLWAQMRILLPSSEDRPNAPPEFRSLESNRITIEGQRRIPPEQIEYAFDTARNLLTQTKVKVSVSSTHNAIEADSGERGMVNSAWLIDGSHLTNWVAAEADSSPTIELNLTKGLPANRILITHARYPEAISDLLPRPAELEVVVNQEEPMRIFMHPDRGTKTLVALKRLTTVSRIEIKLLTPIGGSDMGQAMGLSEIELQNRRPDSE